MRAVFDQVVGDLTRKLEVEGSVDEIRKVYDVWRFDPIERMIEKREKGWPPEQKPLEHVNMGVGGMVTKDGAIIGKGYIMRTCEMCRFIETSPDYARNNCPRDACPLKGDKS